MEPRARTDAERAAARRRAAVGIASGGQQVVGDTTGFAQRLREAYSRAQQLSDEDLEPPKGLMRSAMDDDDDSFLNTLHGFVTGTVPAVVRGGTRGVFQVSAMMNNLAGILEERAQERITGQNVPAGTTRFGQRAQVLRKVASDIGRTEAAIRGSDAIQADREARGGPGFLEENLDMAPGLGRALDNFGRDIKFLQELAGSDPQAAAAFAADLVGSNAPQLGLTIGATVAAGPAGGFAAGSALSTAGVLEDAAVDPEAGTAREVSDRAIASSVVAGTVSGAFEALGVRGIVAASRKIAARASVSDEAKDGIFRALSKRLLSAGKASSTEGFTEGVQTVIENAGAKYGFDPDRAYDEGLTEGVLAGTLLGGGVSIGGGGVDAARQRIQQRTDTRLNDAVRGLNDAFEQDVGSLDVESDEAQRSESAPSPNEVPLTPEEVQSAQQELEGATDDAVLAMIEATEESEPIHKLASAELERRGITDQQVTQPDDAVVDPGIPEPAPLPDEGRDRLDYIAFQAPIEELAHSAEVHYSDQDLARIARDPERTNVEKAVVAQVARMRGLTDVRAAVEGQIHDIKRGRPVTMEAVNRMNRRDMVKAARERGVEAPANIPTPDLGRTLIQSDLPEVDMDGIANEDEYWDRITKSENRFELMDALLTLENDYDRYLAAVQGTKEWALAEFFAGGGPGGILDGKQWMGAHDLFVDNPAARMRFFKAREVSGGRVEKGMGPDELVSELNAEFTGGAIYGEDGPFTEEEVVDYLKSNPTPSSDLKAMREDPRRRAILDRFHEITGRPISKKGLDAHRRFMESEAVQDQLIRPGIEVRSLELIDRLAPEGVDPSVMSNGEIMQMVEDLENLQDPTSFSEQLIDVRDQYSDEELYHVARTLEGIVWGRVSKAQADGRAGGESVGLQNDTARADESSDPQEDGGVDEDPHYVRMGFIPESIEGPINRAIRRVFDPKKMERFAKRTILPQGDAPLWAYGAVQGAEGKKNAIVQEGRFILRELDRAYAQVNGGFNKISGRQVQALNAFLHGTDRGAAGEPITEPLPKKVYAAAVKMRSFVDRLSRSLIESGAATGDLAVIIDENLGTYFTRTYRATTDPKWAETLKRQARDGNKQAERILNRAKNEIRRRITGQQARRKADKAFLALLNENPKLQRDLFPDYRPADGSGPKVVSQRMRATEPYQNLFDAFYQQTNVADAAVNAEINKYLKFENGGYLGSIGRLPKNLGIFQKRLDLEGWERALLGEHTDPRQNFIASVGKIGDLLETHRMLRDMRDQMSNRSGAPEPAFWHPDDFVESDLEGEWVQLSAEGNERLRPLDGYYAPVELIEALDAVFGAEKGFNPVWKKVLQFTGLTKAGKVVYSAQTQVRNFVSASLFPMSQGYFPTRQGAKRAVQLAANMNVVERGGKLARKIGAEKIGQETWDESRHFRIGDRTVTNDREMMLALLGEKVLNENTAANDIARLLKDVDLDRFVDDVLLNPDVESLNKAASDWYRFGVKKPQQFYLFGDNVWKIVSFEREYAALQEIYPAEAATAEGRAKLFKKAAELTRNQSPTYSMVSPNVQALRRNPLVGPFVSFHYEALRTFINTGRRAKFEITEGRRTGNKALAKRGYYRTLGAALTIRAPVALWSSVSYAISALTDFGFGDDERDKAALRTIVPDYYRNTDLVPLWRQSDGISYMNVGFMNPWNSFSDPTMLLYRHMAGKTWTQGDIGTAYGEAMKEFLGPYVIDMDIFVPSLMQAWTGFDDQGRAIWNRSDDPEERVAKGLEYLGGQLKPGILSQAQRILDPNRKTGVEAAAVMTGHRLSFINPEQQLSFKMAEFQRGISDSSSDFLSTMRRRDLDLNMAIKALRETNADRARHFGDSYQYAAAVNHLMRGGRLYPLLRGKTSKENARVLDRAMYQPYKNTSALDRSIKQAKDTEYRAALERNKRILRQAMREVGIRPQPLPTKYLVLGSQPNE